ncbi:MAG TPA: hypothetical protein DF699_04145, partial [Phycisphaerales bacterium]|nr:hypothetical protein [Phycisphaerales bacterium]
DGFPMLAMRAPIDLRSAVFINRGDLTAASGRDDRVPIWKAMKNMTKENTPIVVEKEIGG